MIFLKWKLCCTHGQTYHIFWNFTPKNISDRQQCVQFWKSQKVLNHSTLTHTQLQWGVDVIPPPPAQPDSSYTISIPLSLGGWRTFIRLMIGLANRADMCLILYCSGLCLSDSVTRVSTINIFKNTSLSQCETAEPEFELTDFFFYLFIRSQGGFDSWEKCS